MSRRPHLKRAPPIAVIGIAVLTASAVGLGIMAWQAYGAAPLERPLTPDVSPGIADLRLPPARLAGGDASEAVLARPLFSASRRPFVAPPPPVPETSDAGATLSASIVPDLVVDGIWLHGELKRAHLKRNSDDAGEWLTEGDVYEGWRVTAITPSNVTLMLDSQAVTIELYPPLTAAGP